MNRIELKEKIIEEGKKRGIIVTDINILNCDEYIEYIPTIQNNYASNWVYRHEVEDLIADVTPVERPYRIGTVNFDDSRYNLFNVGDKVELGRVWIRLNAGEEEPKEIINGFIYCGQYIQGWVTGTVFETPKQNGRMLGIKFDRDVWIEEIANLWPRDINHLEDLIKRGEMKKVEKGQPVWCGTHSWYIRKK